MEKQDSEAAPSRMEVGRRRATGRDALRGKKGKKSQKEKEIRSSRWPLWQGLTKDREAGGKCF